MRRTRISLLLWVLPWTVAATSVPFGGGQTERADATRPPPILVRAAYAPMLQHDSSWHPEFRCALARASRLLEGVLGRELQLIGRAPWKFGGLSTDLYELRADIGKTVDPDGADLVIGLATQQPRGATPSGAVIYRENGLAGYSSGSVVLRVGPGDLCDAHRLMAHEIAHVFGGVHRNGAGNLMNRGQPGDIIDPLNAELLALHRDRRVRLDPPPLQRDDLRMLWRLASASLESAETWTRVGYLATKMEMPHDAIRFYQRARDLDPESGTAWITLGHALLRLERFDEAERSYLEALRLGSDEGIVQNNLAVVCLSTGRPEEAAVRARRALELGFDVPPGLIGAIEQATGRRFDRGT